MAENDSSSSSAVLGRIVWQTSMSMTDNGIKPAIDDRFQSNRWTEPQYHQGMIKYTQYIETGRTEIHDAEAAEAIAATAMSIDGVEKVDFGWLEEPKFVCFSNYTPEDHTGATIIIGFDNDAIRTNTEEKPDWAVSSTMADTNYCQACFEIPDGVTIGPIIIPPGTTYWAYKDVAEESSASDNPPGAILITEAYDA